MDRPPLSSFMSANPATSRPPLDSFLTPTSAPDSPQANSVADYAMAVPEGITKGLMGLVAAPREVNDLAAKGVDWATGTQGHASLAKALGLPSYQDVKGGFENAVNNVGNTVMGTDNQVKMPEAQGSIPKMIETGASFATPVPGGGAVSLPSAVARATAGVASEAAGQATEGTSLEIPARIAAALAAGKVGGKFEGDVSKGLAGTAPTAAKSTEEFNAIKNDLYKAAENSGTVYDKSKLAQVATDVETELQRKGFSPNDHTYTANLLKRVKEGQNLTLPGVDALRQSAYKGPADADGAFSKIVGSKLGNFLSDDASLAAGAPSEGIALNRQARDANKLVEANRIADDLDEAVRTRARGTTAPTAATNFIRNLAKDDDRMKFLTPDQQKVINKAAETGNGQRALMMLGSLGPNRLAGAVNLGLSVANPGFLALNGVGVGAQVADRMITNGKVARVTDQLRTQGEGAPTIGSKLGTGLRNLYGPPGTTPPPMAPPGVAGPAAGMAQSMAPTAQSQQVVTRKPPSNAGFARPEAVATAGAIGAAGTLGTAAVASYLNKTRSAESGGVNNAQNSKSSAYGPFQFTRGTWQKMIDKYAPDLGKRSDVMQLRSNPQVAEYMAGKLAEENAGYLSKKDVPINDGSLYVAHFSGGPRAARMYIANPKAPATKFFAPFEIEANPSILKNKTIGQVIKTLEKKVS